MDAELREYQAEYGPKYRKEHAAEILKKEAARRKEHVAEIRKKAAARREKERKKDRELYIKEVRAALRVHARVMERATAAPTALPRPANRR